MKILPSYLRRQAPYLALLVVFAAVFALVFSLYDLPEEAVGYAAGLCLGVGLVPFFLGLFLYARRHRQLQKLLKAVELPQLPLPAPRDTLEQDYQALLQAVCAHRSTLKSQSEDRYRDMLDYYTLWAHQIKTPIAAAELLVQSAGAQSGPLAAELLKIEQYVEMVLSYLRLGSESTDYVLRRCALDDIIRGAVRKFARLFILKHISLDFQETGRTVLTDAKWLSFVLEQLLSNALKYTPEGGSIRIYGDGTTLVVMDTGIGIRAEDLPRVFEKGFTGLNGRSDRKSTGIGLYLCRQVMDRLGHGISLSSRPGRGTLVRLDLENAPQVIE